MSSLVERMKIEASDIASTVLREVYKNPFWQHRYGERGRKFVEEDAYFHLQYLEQAYVANDAQIMASYARWLRTLLTSRGMTTRHLAENFRFVGIQLSARFGEEAAPLLALLDTAKLALLYDEQPARELQEHSVSIGEKTLEQLSFAHSAWAVRPMEAPGIGASELCADLLSYTADAVALSRPELYTTYVELLRALLESKGASAAELTELKKTLSSVVFSSRLSPAAKSACEQLFSRTSQQEQRV